MKKISSLEFTIVLFFSFFSNQISCFLKFHNLFRLTTSTLITATGTTLESGHAITHSHIHFTQYPSDNYSHILGVDDSNHVPSKLQSITELRIKDVIRNKKPIDTEGCGIDRTFYISSDDYLEQIGEFDEVYGKPRDLYNHILSKQPQVAIAAEFKRASPSKGDINIDLDVEHQCLQYAESGAAIISVLTEFQHFKGTLADMKKVRLATQKRFGDSRPAILRKDFVIDRYQILEARANGADTVLLIVAILGVDQLKDLMAYAREMGMEPLVEVHTDLEMEIALDCGAKVIGVNNRNLHTFQLDLGTTERVIKIAQRRGLTWDPTTTPKPDILIAALSGITVAEDIRRFRSAGVSCCLIGETLMKAADPKAAIRDLLRYEGLESERTSTLTSTSSIQTQTLRPIVKVCGVTQVEDAQTALRAGSGLIGVIFAKSPRSASVAQAKAIVKAVRAYGERTARLELVPSEADSQGVEQGGEKGWFGKYMNMLRRLTVRRPLVVGVFQNQSPEEINSIVAETGVDLIQLHGDEAPELIHQLTVPVIKVLHCTTPSPASTDTTETDANEVLSKLQESVKTFSGRAIAILLDSKLPGKDGGGAGVVFDWDLAEQLDIPVILAGGLNSLNVKDALSRPAVNGVDVSSGVEFGGRPGIKDPALVKDFVSNCVN